MSFAASATLSPVRSSSSFVFVFFFVKLGKKKKLGNRFGRNGAIDYNTAEIVSGVVCDHLER